MSRSRRGRKNNRRAAARYPNVVPRAVTSLSARHFGPANAHHFVKTIKLDDFVVQGAISTESSQDYNFTHDLIPGYADLVDVFSRVRINKLTYTFIRTNNGNYQGVSPFNSPLMTSVVDPLGIYPGTVGASLEYEQPYVQIHVPNDSQGTTIVRSFEPAIAAEIYGGITPGYQPEFKSIVNLNDTSIIHYGLRMLYQCPASGSAGSEEWARFYVLCTIDYDLFGQV